LKFSPGDVLVTREVWRARFWAARAMVCLEDSADLIAMWLPRGAQCYFPRALDGGRLRVPSEDWVLYERIWDLHDNVVLVRPSEAYALHLIFEHDGTPRKLYVNLQEPLRRTARGFDYMDLALDVVIAADRSAWEWKDEDDLAAFVTHDLLTPEQAAAVRAEGERVIALAEAGADLFDDPWRRWPRPDGLPIPELPAGWDKN